MFCPTSKFKWEYEYLTYDWKPGPNELPTRLKVASVLLMPLGLSSICCNKYQASWAHFPLHIHFIFPS